MCWDIGNIIIPRRSSKFKGKNKYMRWVRKVDNKYFIRNL
jgi:hypothetical protein